MERPVQRSHPLSLADLTFESAAQQLTRRSKLVSAAPPRTSGRLSRAAHPRHDLVGYFSNRSGVAEEGKGNRGRVATEEASDAADRRPGLPVDRVQPGIDDGQRWVAWTYERERTESGSSPIQPGDLSMQVSHPVELQHSTPRARRPIGRRIQRKKPRRGLETALHHVVFVHVRAPGQRSPHRASAVSAKDPLGQPQEPILGTTTALHEAVTLPSQRGRGLRQEP
jgi:hypothetical protein